LSEAAVKRCLRFFKAINEKGGSAGKWDLIKVAGNEAAFKRWVEDFLVYPASLKRLLREAEPCTGRRREEEPSNACLKTTTTSWLSEE
jgi:hypothetical protein